MVRLKGFLQGDIPLCIHYSLLNMTLTDPPSMAMSLGGCFWASIQCKEAAGRCYKAPRHRMATYFIEWAAKLWRGWGYCCFLMTSVKNASTSCRQIIHAAAEPDDFFESHELWLLPYFGEYVLQEVKSLGLVGQIVSWVVYYRKKLSALNILWHI